MLVPFGCSYVKEFSDIGAEVRKIRMPSLHMRNFFSIILTNIKLIGLTWKEKVAIVHFNLPVHIDSSFLFILFLKLFRIPFFIHVRSPLIFSAFERFLMRWGRLIYVSKAIQNQFLIRRQSDFLARPFHERGALIYDGRKLSKYLSDFSPLGLEKELKLSGGRVVGFVGALDEIKRPDLFLQVAACVKTRSQASVRFLMVGDIREQTDVLIQYKERLLQLRDELNLQEDVTFTGYRNDVEDIFKLIDVLVLTSKRDCLPGTVIEAMAFGKPVVASAVDGVVEMVDDGETGYLISNGDPADYAEKILELLANDSKRSEMARKARLKAKDLFDIHDHVFQVESLYYSALGMTPKQRATGLKDDFQNIPDKESAEKIHVG
ncbi:MAG: glycosyltransferase family 4 protein [Candidatus Omnitrophica bacterium]|nr:glycosyltransferase family 4 protein [Candidatus Omnitrophota bacterium]